MNFFILFWGKMHNKNQHNQGFTVIEIAIAMIIFGALISVFGQGLVAYQTKLKYDRTYERLDAIQIALDEFIELNGRLPCVAPTNIEPGNVGFGVETPCVGAIAGTSFYDPVLGGFPVGGANPNLGVRVGSVPVRTLNLPDSHMLDAWGSRLTFAISIRQTAVGTYFQGGGALPIVDRNGNPVINQIDPPFAANNRADYAVLSHGEDRLGGITMFNDNANPPTPYLPCPAAAVDQSANCTHTVIAPTIIVSDVLDDNNYDDLVVYKAGTITNQILPAGAVMAYDQNYVTATPASRAYLADGAGSNVGLPVALACPPGWAVHAPAQGRFIMGATRPGPLPGGAGVNVDRTRRNATLNVAAVVRNYANLGASGEEAATTTPPYITTLFCEKQ